MKQVILLAASFVLFSCESKKEPEPQTQTTSVTATVSDESPKVTYALPTLYSATWEAGDPNLAAKLLTIGADWMNGSFASFENSFADSMSIYFSSGDKWLAKRDSVISMMRGFRKNYSEIKGEIHSVVPLRHRDTKEDWVCIWLKEVTTTTKGRKDSVELQENWRFNSQGKAELIYQYSATIKPVKK